jgi:aspartyl-tRNA(Asn)/glutamyl-tRNA(Gln) amidotransferase subunit A
MDKDLVFTPAWEMLELLASKQLSPVELTQLYFDRIEEMDSQLNSYLTLTYDAAMKAARSAEQAIVRGEKLGPLHGLPISIKDTQMTGGIRTTYGSVVFKDRIPERDSAVVERVRSAGAIILGKTNVPEFALVGACENSLGDHGRNPWNTDHTPGGSSGGAAAATAAGLCPMATGGDGGGSIRIPAHFCGIYGIKPTQGRVSGYTGVEGPPMPNTLTQSGPLSRTVRDSALLLQVMAGYDPRDPTTLRESPPDFVAAADKDIKGLRIAWSPDFGYASVNPEILDVTTRAAQVFEEFGCRVEDSDFAVDLPKETDTTNPVYEAFGPLYDVYAHVSGGAYLDEFGERMTYFARDSIERGGRTTGAGYARALGLIDVMKARMDEVFQEYDLLLSPTATYTALPISEFTDEVGGWPEYPRRYLNGTFTLPVNVIGHAAATVPAGFDSQGLPIGLHIVGKKGGEETVIAASAAFEKARPWAQHRPPVS